MKKTLAILIMFLAASPLQLLHAARRSGWTIFQKIESTQFRGNTVTSMGYADMAAVLYNPAVPATFRRKEWVIVSEVSGDERLGAVFVGLPAGRTCTVSAGAGYYDAGPAELNWIDGSELRSETVSLQKDMLAVAALSCFLSRSLAAGVAVKGASSEIAQQKSACAIAADAGFVYQPRARLAVTGAVQNMGGASAFIREADPLPLAAHVGAGYAAYMSGSAYVLATGGCTYLVNDERAIPECGLEIDGAGMSFNAGCQFNKDERNIHLGFAFAVKKYTVGYAFKPGRYLAGTHLFSLTRQFN